MDDLRRQAFSEEVPDEEPGKRRFQLPNVVGMLSPGQRLLLSVFLFLDVCILCFACLFLLGKISLPI